MVRGRSRSQLHMAHELAGALQHAGWIWEGCALKESHVYVRCEYIDAAEGHVSQTCDRAAVVQKLADFVTAFSHHLEPLMGDGSQFAGVVFHPCIDGRIALDGAVELRRRRVSASTRGQIWSIAAGYHTLQRFAFTIACPDLQWNAS
jgi:hypothetical protein